MSLKNGEQEEEEDHPILDEESNKLIRNGCKQIVRYGMAFWKYYKEDGKIKARAPTEPADVKAFIRKIKDDEQKTPDNYHKKMFWVSQAQQQQEDNNAENSDTDSDIPDLEDPT
jgi:hypothetical protein